MLSDSLKKKLLQQLSEHLQSELSAAFEAVNEAHANATHEESKPENQYDTLALEAAYLAHGQSERIAGLQSQVTLLNHLELRHFGEDDPIAAGALILLENSESGSAQSVFLLPAGGGVKLNSDDTEVITVTPDAPLGAALQGNYEGDEVKLSVAGKEQIYEIVKVI